jgi:hypothetical protein
VVTAKTNGRLAGNEFLRKNMGIKLGISARFLNKGKNENTEHKTNTKGITEV